MTERQANWHGMNWCSQHKRLSIYLRDGLACVYCGAKLVNGAKLTLDHYIPHVKGGSNDTKNLVTCCEKCNSSKSSRTATEFIEAVSNYLGISYNALYNHVNNCRRRKADKKTAKELVDRQGSCFKVLNHIKSNDIK